MPYISLIYGIKLRLYSWLQSHDIQIFDIELDSFPLYQNIEETCVFFYALFSLKSA